ncbi:hypothetical protein [Dermabacter vaginalis]|uniref:Uncharacterized protein n=1 Tax=Dermabacter vaginalis TaxID=1630135 RepID=A0ABX6A496_9MICO|nr:hypothetical protein [Dermabacter vaginalis]MCG7444458.1 hypothetical protein [Dermabacter vaginalis]QEU10940.1 hypothetical protein FOB48_00525 [Dermabacter vaginalis]
MALMQAPWAGTPVERYEYCVRKGLENIERLEALTSFLVHTKAGQLFDTSLAKFAGKDPYTVNLAFGKDQRKLLLEVFLEKQVHINTAATLVVRFDLEQDTFVYNYVDNFGGDEQPVSTQDLLELAEELRKQ